MTPTSNIEISPASVFNRASGGYLVARSRGGYLQYWSPGGRWAIAGFGFDDFNLAKAVADLLNEVAGAIERGPFKMIGRASRGPGKGGGFVVTNPEGKSWGLDGGFTGSEFVFASDRLAGAVAKILNSESAKSVEKGPFKVVPHVDGSDRERWMVAKPNGEGWNLDGSFAGATYYVFNQRDLADAVANILNEPAVKVEYVANSGTALALINKVLAVGSILPDDRIGKPSVVYGHPSNVEWQRIFLAARDASIADTTGLDRIEQWRCDSCGYIFEGDAMDTRWTKNEAGLPLCPNPDKTPLTQRFVAERGRPASDLLPASRITKMISETINEIEFPNVITALRATTKSLHGFLARAYEFDPGGDLRCRCCRRLSKINADRSTFDTKHSDDCSTLAAIRAEREANEALEALPLPGKSSTEAIREALNAGFDTLMKNAAGYVESLKVTVPAFVAANENTSWRMKFSRELAERIHAEGAERCAICSWPLAAKADEGCVRGNCSMRGGSDAEIERRRKHQDAVTKIATTVEAYLKILDAPVSLSCPKCGGALRSSNAHGSSCANAACKWGWETELDGSPLKPPIETPQQREIEEAHEFLTSLGVWRGHNLTWRIKEALELQEKRDAKAPHVAVANEVIDACLECVPQGWETIRRDIGALRGRFAIEVTPPPPPPTEMYVCEIAHVILHPGQTYRFSVKDGCQGCKDYFGKKSPTLEERAPVQQRIKAMFVAVFGDSSFYWSDSGRKFAGLIEKELTAVISSPQAPFDEWWASTNNGNFFKTRPIDIGTLRMVAKEAYETSNRAMIRRAYEIQRAALERPAARPGTDKDSMNADLVLDKAKRAVCHYCERGVPWKLDAMGLNILHDNGSFCRAYLIEPLKGRFVLSPDLGKLPGDLNGLLKVILVNSDLIRNASLVGDRNRFRAEMIKSSAEEAAKIVEEIERG